MNTKAIATAALMSLCIVAPSAHAGGFSFDYQQSEIDSEKGRKKVLKRLLSETRAYCVSEYRNSPAGLRGQQACRGDLIASIVDEIDDTRFAALVDDQVVLASR